MRIYAFSCPSGWRRTGKESGSPSPRNTSPTAVSKIVLHFTQLLSKWSELIQYFIIKHGKFENSEIHTFRKAAYIQHNI